MAIVWKEDTEMLSAGFAGENLVWGVGFGVWGLGLGVGGCGLGVEV